MDIMINEEISTSELRKILIEIFEADKSITIFRIKQMVGLEN
tara:strand:- start:395 stop:520 length:126 start_codon:yes stop_codon:yes gene_type:complete